MYSNLPFIGGVVLLLLVLFVPGLNGLFMVSPAFNVTDLGIVALLALAPTVLIQIFKIIRDIKNRK